MPSEQTLQSTDHKVCNCSSSLWWLHWYLIKDITSALSFIINTANSQPFIWHWCCRDMTKSYVTHHVYVKIKGGGTGGARGAIAPPKIALWGSALHTMCYLRQCASPSAPPISYCFLRPWSRYDNMSWHKGYGTQFWEFWSFTKAQISHKSYLKLATEFFNRSICLSAHIDMAWLPLHTMLKPFYVVTLTYQYIMAALFDTQTGKCIAVML